MPGLELHGVSKGFGGIQAVDHVSLQVEQGQFVCFLGPSGCGKTTLLRMVAGLDAPDSGRIMLDGRDLTQTPVHRRNFAMVFQALALFPHLNVEQNIAYSLKLRGMDRRARGERVRELLELIRLPDVARRPIAQLSGGQKQRVAIARALAQEPALFLLDEPLSALDAKLRDHLQVELRQLQQKLRITTILVTHDQREAMTIADVIVVMANGTVQQVGAPLDIYRNPANRFVAGFIGQSNLLAAEVLDRRHVRLCGRVLEVQPVPVSLREGDQVTLSIRPENVRVGPRSDRPGTLPGCVTFIRDVGATREIRVECDGHEIIGTAGPSDWSEAGHGGQVSVELPAASCSLLLH